MIMLLSLAASGVASGTDFQNARLKRIASYLPKEFVERQDSVAKPLGYPCEVIKRTERGMVSHLGFRFFDSPVGGNMQQVVNFLERITLELYQQENDKQMTLKLNELKMTWKENGKETQRPFASLSKFLMSSGGKDNLTIDFVDKKFNAKWIVGRNTYELIFPAVRELIQGIDLGEAEGIFLDELRNENFSSVKEQKTMPLTMLKQIKGGMYRSSGAVYSQQRSYTNDTYYYRLNNGYAKAIYSPDYPSESVVNMMAGTVPCGGRKLDLSFHLYGGKIEHMTVPFAMVYSSLFHDMHTYTKYDISDSKMHYARFLYENEEMQYVHVIEIEIPPQKAFDENATLKAHLYCYIPQHNLKKIIDKK